jgi:hypothetical protein
MRRALLSLAMLLIAAVGASHPSSGIAVKYCVVCFDPVTGAGCYANYGEVCTAPLNYPHCTDAQASAWCPGHV